MDTIYALSTARGKAGVAVIRVSGPVAFEAAEILSGIVSPGREPKLRTLKTRSGQFIDQALVLAFQEGKSFTGEQSVEFQCHGGSAIISELLNQLSMIDGCRLAEPGEFTRRAIENGKIDLTQAEGLADLIDAETEAQRRQAARVFSGALSNLVSKWREKLVRAAALLEATIDFADEEVPEDVLPEVNELLGDVLNDITNQITGVYAAERIREGFEVAIVGAPNVGKSTLLNAIAGREAAITSKFAGTTRDIIEVRLDLNGLPVTFLDTAGLRETEDKVENIGIQRAVERALNADLRVFLELDESEISLSPKDQDIVLKGKNDLYPTTDMSISGKTGEGVSELLNKVDRILSHRAAGAGLAIKHRHKSQLVEGAVALTTAVENLSRSTEHSEIIAQDIRSALAKLDALLGKTDVEDILDEVFSSFCLGK